MMPVVALRLPSATLRTSVFRGIATSAYRWKTTSTTSNAALFQLVCRRKFGITDNLVDMAKKKLEDQREKDFSSFLKVMVDSPKWSMRPWRTSIESQLSSWSMYLPGVSASSEIVEVKKFKEMLDVMNVQEIENPEAFSGATKERIMKASGKTAEDFSRMLYVWKQTLVVYLWLQEKKKLNEAMPTTQAELMEMQSTDSRIRVIGTKIMAPPGKQRTGRGRRAGF